MILIEDGWKPLAWHVPEGKVQEIDNKAFKQTQDLWKIVSVFSDLEEGLRAKISPRV